MISQKIKLAIFVFLSGFLVSCATDGNDEASGTLEKRQQRVQAQKARAAKAKRAETLAPEISPLAVSNLPAGKCGMLLWTLDAGKPVMIFRMVVREDAEMIINEVPTRLALASESGNQVFGVARELEYTGQAGMVVRVSVNFGQNFDGGTYLEKGLISLTNSEGWERVNPVAGLAGCRS